MFDHIKMAFGFEDRMLVVTYSNIWRRTTAIRVCQLLNCDDGAVVARCYMLQYGICFRFCLPLIASKSFQCCIKTIFTVHDTKSILKEKYLFG